MLSAEAIIHCLTTLRFYSHNNFLNVDGEKLSYA